MFEAGEIGPFVDRLARRIASFPAEAIAAAKAAVNAADPAAVEGLNEETFIVQGTLRNESAQRNMRRFLEIGGQTPEGERRMGELCAQLGRLRYRDGQVTRARLQAFQGMERRGVLEFWRRTSIRAIDKAALLRWERWLRHSYGHLAAVSLRHVLRDFGTFIRWMHTVGAMTELPQFPKIKISKARKRVPNRQAGGQHHPGDS